MKVPTTAVRLAATMVAALIASGCSAWSPNTTAFDYAASDGIHVVAGDVRIVNLLMLATGEDEPAILIGALINKGDEATEISFLFGDGEELVVEVAANAVVNLGPGENETLIIGSAPVTPGLAANVVVIPEGSGPIDLQVPVMDGTLPEYADVIAQIPAPDPSPEPAPSPSPSASPSVSPSPRPSA